MKPSPDQLGLDYEGSFAERMGAFRARLDAIDPALLDATPTQWDRVCRLLRAVFAFASAEWDRYAQVAPERLQASAEMSRRQVSDARVLARKAGLLDAQRHYPNRGEHRKADRLWVVRERFDELVARSRAQPGATGRNPPPTVTQPGAHKETHSLTVSPSLHGRRSTKEKNEQRPPAEWLAPPDPRAALRVGKAIGRPRSPRDRELAWKLAALEPVLGEAWLAGVLAAVRECRPSNPWAYAWRVAADGTAERPGPGAKRLGRLLARVAPPPPDWPGRTPDLSQRLCVAEDA